jgi:small-conductance mechanosensitive channel
VTIKLWDLRRMVVPLSYFIEKPFQNWSRENSSSLIGSVMLYVDYRAPVALIREKLMEILRQSERWDGTTAALQVTDFKEGSIELRCLMSARAPGQTFDLRCEVREKLIDFLQREHPEALPHSRQISLKGDAEDAGGGSQARQAKLAPAGPRPAAHGCVCMRLAAILLTNSSALVRVAQYLARQH